MARAFTEEERTEIKERIMETALELVHNKGKKSLNIQELTKRVGIAQGSFYNFWKDKDSLIIDLIAYRSVQKLSKIEKEFSSSLKDPVQFLTDVIYESFMYLMTKIQTQPIYEEAFKIIAEKDKGEVKRIETLYSDFFSRLISYWKTNDVIKSVDEQGLSNALIGSFILCSNSQLFNKNYFGTVLRIYIYGIVSKYIEIEVKESKVKVFPKETI